MNPGPDFYSFVNSIYFFSEKIELLGLLGVDIWLWGTCQNLAVAKICLNYFHPMEKSKS